MRKIKIKSISGDLICQINATNRTDAVIRAIKGGISLENADLEGVNLSDCGTISDGDFRGACMSDVNVGGTTFLRCDFRRVNFKYGNFLETAFIDCDLRKAVFLGSDMRCTYYKNVKHPFDKGGVLS